VQEVEQRLGEAGAAFALLHLGGERRLVGTEDVDVDVVSATAESARAGQRGSAQRGYRAPGAGRQPRVRKCCRHGGSERRRSRRRLLRLRVFERLAKLGVLTLQVPDLAFEPDDLELRHA
jgi:hypothetical protein